MYTQIILLAALAAQTVADLTCNPYVPKNWTSNTAKVSVFDQGVSLHLMRHLDLY